jgi:hypothetical protein
MHAANRLIFGLLVSILWMHGSIHGDQSRSASAAASSCGCFAAGAVCSCGDDCPCVAAPAESPPADPVAPPAPHKTNWLAAHTHIAVVPHPPVASPPPNGAVTAAQAPGIDLARRPHPRLCVWVI